MSQQSRAASDEVFGRLETVSLLGKAVQEDDGRLIVVDGLRGGAKAGVAAYLASDRTLLYIAANDESARAVHLDLGALAPRLDSVLFPGWSTAENMPRSPSIDVLSTRVETLHALRTQHPNVVVSTRPALGTWTAAPEELERATEVVHIGMELDPLALLERLSIRGYERVDTVQEIGDVALRGGIVDAFTFGLARPVRIEFWGDSVDSIREFAVSTQRSVGPRSTVTLLPRREIVIDEKRREDLSTRLRGAGKPRLADRIGVDPYFEGYESSLAPYVEDPCTVGTYFRENGLLLVESGDGDDAPTSSVIVQDPEAVLQYFEQWRRVELQDLDVKANGDRNLIRVAVRPPPIPSGRSDALVESVSNLTKQGLRTLVYCENETHQRRCREILSDNEPPIEVRVGVLSGGFVLPDAGIAFLADHEVFRRSPSMRDAPRFEEGAHVTDAFSLEPGDYIVHIDHGTGVFEGIDRLVVDRRRTDCLRLGYLGGDRLFVPIDQLDRVQRLRDTDDAPIPKGLDKLGGKSWARRLQRTKHAIERMAKDLLDLYAKRSQVHGHRFDEDGAWEKELAEAFPWEETHDQLRAADEIRQDQLSSRAMDRLICGDVGFGKTEVALRATFKAVLGGKQVAVLVPTTLLAEQHHETFRSRFSAYPIELRSLSRFRTAKSQREIVDGLRSGRVDIVIGTHRILSTDVQFADLGLLIVDEEHRFGVRQKEKIKGLKLRADCLSMTATPIPRTLHMALSGIRDLSLIATPPKNRFPVETEVLEFSETVIREAIERELARDGQVFFVHNRVRTLGAMEGLLRKIVPDARIVVAHGQMPERELEKAMTAFYRAEADLLISTMIVESGLDLPNANTLIVHRADRLGLAQLHQLRGRVGRGSRKASAYFLVPRHARLHSQARRRLRAVRDHTELGAGYSIALRDMEIRGVGNLLGSEQHGFIHTVGFETYCRLLSEVVAELEGDAPPRDFDLRIHAQVDAYVPEGYIPEPAERFTLYKRLSRFTDPLQPSDLLAECRDRFGPPPEALENLVHLKELEIRLRSIGVEDLILGSESVDLGWTREHAPKARTLEKLATILAGRVLFRPSDRLRATVQGPSDLVSALELVKEMRKAFEMQGADREDSTSPLEGRSKKEDR